MTRRVGLVAGVSFALLITAIALGVVKFWHRTTEGILFFAYDGRLTSFGNRVLADVIERNVRGAMRAAPTTE